MFITSSLDLGTLERLRGFVCVAFRRAGSLTSGMKDTIAKRKTTAGVLGNCHGGKSCIFLVVLDYRDSAGHAVLYMTSTCKHTHIAYTYIHIHIHMWTLTILVYTAHCHTHSLTHCHLLCPVSLTDIT